MNTPVKTKTSQYLDNNAIELLKNLAALKEAGIITQEEFEVKKQEILDV